jgi:hypothetical protein
MGIVHGLRIGDVPVDGHHVLGTRAPGDLRGHIRDVDGQLVVELRIFVGVQFPPVREGVIPCRPRGGELAARDVLVCRIVGRD